MVDGALYTGSPIVCHRRFGMISTPRFAHVVVLAAVVGLLGAALPGDAQQPSSVQESTAPTAAPPELARFNQLLGDLADRLKPGLVHVRVRRVSPAKDVEGDSPAE